MYKTRYEQELDFLRAEQAVKSTAYHEASQIVTHYSRREVALTLPLLQSIVTSLLLSILVMVVAHHFQWGKWYQVGGISFIVILAGDWIRRSEGWRRSVYQLEEMLKRDITLDGWIGEPEVEPVVETVEIVLRHEKEGKTQWINFPVSRARLAEMASAICYGSAFTEASMSGAGALYSRAEFNAIRDEMLKRGLCQWKNDSAHNMGITFTEAGLRVLRVLAGEHRGIHPSDVALTHCDSK